jgi:hypothetical protein
MSRNVVTVVNIRENKQVLMFRIIRLGEMPQVQVTNAAERRAFAIEVRTFLHQADH